MLKVFVVVDVSNVTCPDPFVKFSTLLFRTDFDRKFYNAGSTELKKFDGFALSLGRVHSKT